MSSLRWVLALAVAVATLRPARAAADAQDTLTPPAEPPLRQPWRIGQWARYRWTSKATGDRTVTVRLLAEDGCGYWIELEVDTPDEVTIGRTCVERLAATTSPAANADHTTMVQRDGITTEINDRDVDATRARLVYRLVRGDWGGKRGLPREDVATAAGATILTIKEDKVDGDAAHTRWSHPGVPLGGLVREVNDRGNIDELVLIEHGMTNSGVLVSDNQKLVSQGQSLSFQRRPRKKWMTFSFGSDLLGTLDDASWANTFGFSLGYKLTPRFALAFNSQQTGLAPYPDMPALAEQLTSAALCARWYPYFGKPAASRLSFLAQALYAQLDLGYAQLQRQRLLGDSNIAGRGGIAGLRVGISTGISQDWKLAIELHEHTALLNSDEGIRVTLGLHAIVELHLP